MNIAIFTDTFIPKFDGVVTSILNTTGELLRLGHRVMITAPRIRPNQEEIVKNHDSRIELLLIPGVNALFYPDFKITPPIAPWIVSRVRKFGADVIHFHTPFTIGLEAIVVSRVLNLPLLSTFHTYFSEPEYLEIVNMDKIPGLVKFGWAYSNFFHEKCDYTISPSEFTAGELKRRKMKGKIEVISNGIPLKEPSPLDEEQAKKIRAKYGLKEKVFIFVGRVSREKSIDVLIKAASIVFKKRKDTTFLIVGDGPGIDEIKDLARSENILDSVVFAGFIPHDELLNSGIFEISSFFATASTSENQPMTIIEACMFGLPIIGVDARGVPEMIRGNGFVAEVGNHREIANYMLHLLEDDELRNKMSKKSLEMGKKYDIRKTTQNLLDLYERVIEAKKAGR